MRRHRWASSGLGLLLLAVAAISVRATVAINEIAWAGNAFDYTTEWIELVNTGTEPIDLDGWRLVSSDGAPDVRLTGILSPRGPGPTDPGYYLLERDSDSAVPSQTADLIYSGALGDRGETLTLYDAAGHVVDTANAAGGPWHGGSTWATDAPPCSMERIDPTLPDERSNWTSARCDADSATSALFCGTPKTENTVFGSVPVALMDVIPASPGPGEVVRLDAGASAGEIVSYVWSFADGTNIEGQTASRTFSEPGPYAVDLIVTDVAGATSSLSKTILVEAVVPPQADFSLIAPSDRTPRAGEPVVFLDESYPGSTPILQRNWTFGDGTSESGERVSHTFEESGTYEVCLSLIDERGGQSQRCVSIRVASRVPSARFTFDEGIHSDTEPIRFDASMSQDPDGEVARYHWDFDGDGQTDEVSEIPEVEHAYDAGGYVSPCLIVEDENGDRSSPTCQSFYVNAGPIPQFSASDFDPPEAADVQFTDCSADPDGTILRWHWDFGDGETSTQTSPMHVFSGSGAHQVALTVTDDQSASRTATATIDVANLPPTAALQTDLEEALTGDPFALDASASSDPSPQGRIASYAWDLDGDGVFEHETAVPTLSQSYPNDGTYTVRVRVIDDDGSTADSAAVELTVLNRSPEIDEILWSAETPLDGAEIAFSARVFDPDGEVVAWEWTFDDEGTDVQSESTHVFQQDRVYAIRLVVCDDDGESSEPYVADVEIGNTPPQASFRIVAQDDRVVLLDASASFDPSPQGEIVHYAWDFGDGTACPDDPDACGTGSQQAPAHRYATAGTYEITLVVIDDDGGIGWSTRSVTIR